MQGKVFSITKVSNGKLSLPSDLLTVSSTVSAALRMLGGGTFVVNPRADIEGRSWEMAAIMCALGRKGNYSGTVEYVDRGEIKFGPVMGINKKIKSIKHLETYKSTPGVLISS